MKVENKIIAVTGAGSGIGREISLNLLAKGAKIVALDINEVSLLKTKELSGNKKDNLLTFPLDITQKEEVDRLPDKIIDSFGAIDGLINNAGIIQPFIKINELEYKDINRVMDINFFGAVNMTKSFLPHLLKRPEAHIVNISSMGGFLPVPGQSIYGASKAALKLFTEGLYSELLDTKVRVTIVLPGAMATNIVENSGVTISDKSVDKSDFKALSAVKAAEIIVQGIEKDRFRILVGSDARFMDFIYRVHPKFATNFIFKKMKSLLS